MNCQDVTFLPWMRVSCFFLESVQIDTKMRVVDYHNIISSKILYTEKILNHVYNKYPYIEIESRVYCGVK